jgi:hypothetical protein
MTAARKSKRDAVDPSGPNWFHRLLRAKNRLLAVQAPLPIIKRARMPSKIKRKTDMTETMLEPLVVS